MASSLGGLPSMKIIYYALLKREGTDRETLEAEMAKVIRHYYHKHKTNLWERRSMRQTSGFLNRLGLSPEDF